jgi:hypothetical protein
MRPRPAWELIGAGVARFCNPGVLLSPKHMNSGPLKDACAVSMCTAAAKATTDGQSTGVVQALQYPTRHVEYYVLQGVRGILQGCCCSAQAGRVDNRLRQCLAPRSAQQQQPQLTVSFHMAPRYRRGSCGCWCGSPSALLSHCLFEFCIHEAQR